jgi:hypothetical protein
VDVRDVKRQVSPFMRGFGLNRLLCGNDCHHPARASKASMFKPADRELGVHGFVIRHVRIL